MKKKKGFYNFNNKVLKLRKVSTKISIVGSKNEFQLSKLQLLYTYYILNIQNQNFCFF